MLIDDLPILFDAQTKISGDLLPGRLVKLEGVTQPGGFIKADSIQLRFYEYAGEVKAIQRDMWLIGDTSFAILNGTRIDPALRIGDRVLVLVYAGDDGRLYAQAILRIPETIPNPTRFKPFEIEFGGIIEAVSADMLIINGKSVQLTNATEIKGDLTIGKQVKVHALVAQDGSLTATEVEAESQAGNQAEDDKKGDDTDTGGEDNPKDDSDDGQDDSKDADKSGDDSSGEGQREDNKDEDKSRQDSGRSDDDKSDSDYKDDDSRDSNSGKDDNGDKDDDSEAGIFYSILSDRLI